MELRALNLSNLENFEALKASNLATATKYLLSVILKVEEHISKIFFKFWPLDWDLFSFSRDQHGSCKITNWPDIKKKHFAFFNLLKKVCIVFLASGLIYGHVFIIDGCSY